MKSWFRQHRYALRAAMSNLGKAPGSFLFNVFVVAIALTLPFVGLTLLENVRPMSRQLSVDPEISLFVSTTTTREQALAIRPGLTALLKDYSAQITFVPREDSERPIILMAGGTGFAPIKAIMEHFLHLGSRRRMHLYWGARNRAELYLLELPQAWVRDATHLHFMPVVSVPPPAGDLRTGMVHEAVLQDHPDLSGFDVYMSGPPAMINAARRAFIAASLPEDHLYYDSFDYAPDVLAQILRNRAGIHGL